MAIKIPQLRENALPTQTGVKTPDANAFGVGVSQSIMDASKMVGQMAIKLQETENHVRAKEAENVFKKQISDLETSYTQLGGKEAYEKRGEFTKQAEDIRKNVLGTLTNPVQQQMLTPVVDSRLIQAGKLSDQHALGELEKWEVGEMTNSAKIYQEQSMLTYGTPQYGANMKAMAQNIDDLGERLHWTPEQIALEKVTRQSAVLTEIIKGAAVDNPTRAKAILQQERGNILKSELVGLEKLVKASDDKARTFAVADALMSQYDPDSADMREALRSVDPEIRSDVQRQVAFEGNARQRARQHQEKEARRAVLRTIQDSDNPTYAMIPASVNPEDKAWLMSVIDTKVANGGVSVTTPQARRKLNKMVATDLEGFKKADLEKEFGAEMTASDLEEAQVMQDKLNSNAVDPKLQDFTLKSRFIENALVQAGIDSDDDDDAAAYEGALTDRLSMEAQAKKRDLTTPEKNAIAREMAWEYRHGAGIGSNTPIIIEKDKWLWFDDEERLGTITFKAKDGTEWEAKHRDRAAREVVRSGLPLTKDNIQEVLNAWEELITPTE